MQLGMTKTNWGPWESGDTDRRLRRSGVEAWGVSRTPSASELPSGLCTPPYQGSVEPLAVSQRLRFLIHQKASSCVYLWKKARA